MMIEEISNNKDPIQEAIAALVFADHLVDEHELEVIEANTWISTYLSQRQTQTKDFTSRLMTAHDDAVVDQKALQGLPLADQEALINLLEDLTAIDDHYDPREVSVLRNLWTTGA